MDLERLIKNAEMGGPEDQYLLFKERQRRGLVTIPETPKVFYRRCYRCNAELTDEASLAWGMGPTCRAHLEGTDHLTDPDLEQLRRLHGLFLADMDYLYWEVYMILAQFGEVLYLNSLSKQIVKDMTRKVMWMLSFPLDKTLTDRLLSFLGHLGNPVLVSLIRNIAIIGVAQVAAVEGTLVLTSPRPKAPVARALRRQRGVFNFTKKTWSFPGSRAKKVASILRSHFLNLQGLEEALAVLEQVPTPNTKGLLDSFIEETEPGIYWASTPYHPLYLTDLKALVPYKSRKWDSVNKVWIIRGAKYLEIVRDLIEEYFIKDRTYVEETRRDF